MGLILRSPDEDAPVPKPVHLILTCDGRHGFFEGERVTQEFGCRDDRGVTSYIVQRRTASAIGWVIQGSGKVLCPACAKRPTEQEKPPKTVRDIRRLPV